MPRSGFTLIELSIVLVVIGLIIGGILTGRNLIDAAAQRAQIAQIEKYNTAVRTFQSKYGYLPGDIPNPYAVQFGFQSRGQYAGEGDGNGIIEGVNGNAAGDNWGLFQISGETPMLWCDLSAAGLIEGTFNTASPYNMPGSNVTGSALNNWFPTAKLGQGNYVYAYYASSSAILGMAGITTTNYWGVSAVTTNILANGIDSSPAMSVQQAYNIDKKIDDGLPQSGVVVTTYINYAITTALVWASGGGVDGTYAGTAVTGSSTTCYDNGGNASGTMQYSLAQNSGNGQNCALSFRLQ